MYIFVNLIWMYRKNNICLYVVYKEIFICNVEIYFKYVSRIKYNYKINEVFIDQISIFDKYVKNCFYILFLFILF